MDLNHLPHEMLHSILEHLSHADLCSLALVSRKLNQSALYPSLWTTAQIDKEKVRVRGIENFALVPRFSCLTNLNLGCSSLTTDQYTSMCSYVLSSPGLVEMQLYGCCLRGVDKMLLADSVIHLEKVNLRNCDMEKKQILSLLEGIVYGETSALVDLNLSGIDLSKINSNIVGQAVSKLVKVDLGSSLLNRLQKTSIFQHNLNLLSKLKILNLLDVDLSLVESSLLGESMSKLSNVDMRNKGLSTIQKTSILSHLISSTTVVELNMSGVSNLSSISPGLLSLAVSRIKKVDLSLTYLPLTHSTEVLKKIALSTEVLDLSLSGVDLSFLDLDVVAKAFCRLYKADLSNTNLNPGQASQLLASVLQSPIDNSMRSLCLSNIDLSSVAPHLLAKAVARLKRADLLDTNLTGYQTTALIIQCLETSKTRLAINRDGNMSGVAGDLIERAEISGRIHFW